MPGCDPAPRSDAGMDSFPFPDTPDDLIKPTVVGMFPSPRSSAPIGTLVTASFSEQVLGVNESTFQLQRSGGSPVNGFVTNDSFSQTATFQPFSSLVPGQMYMVILLDDITDLVGNHLDSSTTWQFTTLQDTTRPTVSSRTPVAGATNVGVGIAPFVTFDENVVGVSSSSFTLRMGATPVAGTVSYASTFGFSATFQPTLQLAADTDYTVSLDASIMDVFGNPLTPVTWDFRTGADLVAPDLASLAPADLSTDIPITATIVIRFNEPVLGVDMTSFTLDGGAIAGTIAMSADNTVATFTPDAALPASTTITVGLTAAITDAATNSLGPVTWSFTTAP